MAAASTRPSRLLELPSELRVRVYEFAFADSGLEEVNVHQIESHLPKPALTAVSRLVRQESLPCYRDAYECFWHGHIIGLDADALDSKSISLQERKESQKDLCAQMEKLPTLGASAVFTLQRGFMANGGINMQNGLRILFSGAEARGVGLKVTIAENATQQLAVVAGHRIVWERSDVARFEAAFEEQGMADYREYAKNTRSQDLSMAAAVAAFT